MQERELDVSDQPRLGVIPPGMSVIQVPIRGSLWKRSKRWVGLKLERIFLYLAAQSRKLQ